MEHCLELKPFYEIHSEKTLLNGSIIEIPKMSEGVTVENPKCGSYVVEKWMKSGMHCFVFVCITPGKRIIFGAKPSQVKSAIKYKQIIVTKY